MSDRITTEDPPVISTSEDESAADSTDSGESSHQQRDLTTLTFQTESGRDIQLVTGEWLISDTGVMVGTISHMIQHPQSGCSWDNTVYIKYREHFASDSIEADPTGSFVGGVPLGEISDQFDRRVLDTLR